MKNLSKLFFISILFLSLALTGCGNRNDVKRSDVSFQGLNTEEIGSESGNYGDLRALLGHITYRGLFDLLDGSLKKLNELQAVGATTTQDAQTLYNILSNMHNMMLDQKIKYESTGEDVDTPMADATDALAKLIQIANANKVGGILNDVIKQTGTNLGGYAMISYMLSADDATLEGLTKGVTIGSFDSAPGLNDGKEQFTKLMGLTHGIINPAADGKYNQLHTDLGNVMDALKTNEIKNLTVGDAKDLASSLLDALSTDGDDTGSETPPYPVENKVFLDNIMSAMEYLWVNDPQFRADLVSLLKESGNLMAKDINGDTDMGRVITAAQQLLAPGHRDHLKQFVTSALHGIARISDGNTLEGVVTGLAGLDTNGDKILDVRNDYSADGIGKGLVYSVTNNMYGQERETADVKTSSLRALMFMMQHGNVKLAYSNLIYTLALMTSPNNGGTVANPIYPNQALPDDAKWNVDIFTIGEVVNAIRWGRAWSAVGHDKTNAPYPFMSAADINPKDDIVDIYEALDWVLYTKEYSVVGLAIPNLTSFSGFVTMVTNPLIKAAYVMPAGINDPFPAFVELAGGKAPSGEGTDVNAFANRKGTAGERHKLFGLFAPLMEYFWDPNGDGNPADERVLDMVALLVYMNEIDAAIKDNIDPAQKLYINYSLPYESLLTSLLGQPSNVGTPNANATLRLDNSGDIMKLIDGGDQRDGGMLYYALRDHDPANITKPIGQRNDGILLDRALDMIVRIVFELDSNKYMLSNGKTTFKGLMEKLNIQAMTEDNITSTVTTLFDGKDGKAPLIDTAYDMLAGDDAKKALVNITTPMGQMLVNLTATNAQTGTANVVALIEDGRAMWPILKGVVKIEDTGDSTLGDFIDYLTKKNDDGSDNAFMLNAKTLAYKVLDIQDSTYNPGGELTDTTPLTGDNGMLVHLLGGVGLVDTIKGVLGLNGLYDLSPLMDFLVEVTNASNSNLLWQAMDQGGTLLDDIMGNESMSVSFLKAFVKPVDVNHDGINDGTVLEDIFNLINLEDVDFNGVLNDVAELLDPENIDLRPGSDTFDGLFNILDFVVKNSVVK